MFFLFVYTIHHFLNMMKKNILDLHMACYASLVTPLSDPIIKQDRRIKAPYTQFHKPS